jgi:anti-anti-sigma factor
MPLTFETRMVGNVAVVTCSGPLVFGESATELHIAAKQHLAEKRAVLLDLADVPSMDSGGVGALFAIYTSSLRSQAKVAVCGLTPLVRNVLQTCMLLPLVKSYPDVQKALAGLA